MVCKVSVITEQVVKFLEKMMCVRHNCVNTSGN